MELNKRKGKVERLIYNSIWKLGSLKVMKYSAKQRVHYVGLFEKEKSTKKP